MLLHPLFHWSPAHRRSSIKKKGLVPGSKPTMNEDLDFRAQYVCLGVTPSYAWALSGARYSTGWDLWQVALESEDTTTIVDLHEGHRIHEVRVHNRIPKSRVWFVGTR